MNFTLEKLKEARDAGIPDDVIWEVASETEPKFLELKQNNIPIDIAIEVFQGGEPEPSGTSFGEEVSQLGSAFVESIGRPLENMGESFESFGFSGVANALKGAITEPENYVSAGQRFMEPAQDEAQLMGFAWQYAPRAAVEQVGQVIGAIGTRAVGAAAGGAVAGPPGAIAGGFLGPAVFGAAQVIGPVAKERAMNNGREVPNNEDLVAATLTAIGSGSLDAIGAKYLPGGDKATGKFFKRVASAFVGEGLLTEAPQSVIEQIGATAGTEKGLNINVKQAVGEGLIGGTSAAGLTAIVSPFSKPAENQVIRTPEEAEELDIDSKANQEAVLLMGDPADQTQNERITKLKEIESVIANNETLMTGLEPNAPERSKLDLENRVAKKEAEKLKAEITQGAGLSETITEAEKQQIELGKLIVAPAPKPLPTDEVLGEQQASIKIKDNIQQKIDPQTGDRISIPVKDFTIETPQKGSAYGYILNNVANIVGIKAPKKEGSVIEAERGTKTYPQVIQKLSESGVTTLRVAMPSEDSRIALEKLVLNGTLSNPRDFSGPSDASYPTTWDIVSEKPSKSVVTEEPPVSMVGKQVIPGVTPVPVVEKTKPAPTKAKTELEKLEDKKQKLILSGAKRIKLVEINSQIEQARQKQIRELEAKGKAIEFVAEMREESRQAQETADRQVKAVAWRNTKQSLPNEWVAANDIINNDSEKLTLSIDEGKVTPERSIELVDEAVSSEAITQVSADIFKKKIQKTFVTSAPTEPTVKDSLTVAPVEEEPFEEEPFGKLPTAEVETGISQRAKEAAIAEEREKIEAPIRRQESINQFLSEGATVKSRTNVVGRKKAAEGGGDITKTAYYLAHPDGKREITLSKKEASDLEAPAITPAPVAETPAVTEAPAAEVAPKLERTSAGKEIIKQAEEGGVNLAELDLVESAIQQIDNPESSVIPESTTAEAVQYLQYTPEGTSIISHLQKLSKSTDKRDAGIKRRTTAILEKITPTPAVSETITPAAEPAGKPATLTQEDVKVRRIRQFLGENAPQAISEAKKALASFNRSNYGKRGDNPFQAEPRLRELKNVISLFVANRLNVTNQNADQIAEQIILGKPNIVDKATELKPIKAKELNDIEANRSAIMRFGYELDDKKTYRHPREAEVITEAPTAEPTGISVGNRIKLGKSPQTYIVEEVVPQSEVEKANDEQYYSVKNEKTGEVQVVEKADMKQVKKSADTRKTVVGDTQYQTEGVIPEDQRFTEDELRVIVNDIFGGKIPDKIEIITDATNPNKEFKAAYSIRRGTITYNLAYLAKGDNLRFVTNHELGHFILGDPKFQVEMARLFDTLPTDIQEKLKKAIDEAYAQEGLGVRAEETIVFAFGEILENAPDGRNILQRFLDAIRDAINRLFKTEGYIPRNPKKAAAAILLAARNKFERGEFIRRPNGSVVSIAPDIRRMAVERKKVMSQNLGGLKDTPKNIIAKTKVLLRERVFNPSEVTEQNTTEAFRALGKLTGNKQERRDFADELNDIATIVEDTGAAAEVSMGAALFVNDLFEYAVRLAAQGQKMMLGIMMTNINNLPTGTEGRSDAGRALRAAREMRDTFLTMAKAEQNAFINYAAEFVYGPNPTKEQVDSIRKGYDAVEEVQEPTAKEVEEEIAAVGEKTGTDLVGKINEEFTKATEKGKEKRKTEIDELDSEYKKIQNQADAEIEKLAKIQSDTPSFDPAAARQTANDVRAIVANDLKQRPDMGRKAPWKSLLVAKLQEAGVEVAAAETLADIVWRQHEINSLSRELSSIDKAIEKGPISEIIKAIKETPLEEQQKPNWRYEVMRDYLRKAGLPLAQAERIAKLMDISLQKRLTQAKEQAFTDAISKTAPWKAGDIRSKRAFQQVLQAIRSGALDPSRNMASDIAALNGWTGFTADQYKNLLKFDTILADEKTGELEKANAYKGVQDIISKSKLPIRARDVIAQYYDAQALNGIPTLSVNSFSPIAFAMRNAIIEAGAGTLKGDPKAIGKASKIFVDSIKSWANTVAFSFKNNVTVYSNVDYIVNDDNLLRLYRRGVDQFQKGNTPREKADGIKNIMIGMMDYVRRVLNALDYGAIAALQNQNVGKYAMAVMKRNNISEKKANEVFAAMMKEKNDFYLNQIAIGTDKNKARILADEYYVASWGKALEKAGIGAEKIKSAMDSAINDAMSSVGRNRQSLDAFKEEATNMRDAGLASAPALWLLESIANAANQSNSQVTKLFARMIYGFAIVPARVIRETAWFSPYGLVRLAVDAGMRNRNMDSRYAQSLGNEFQRQQRLNEAVAGTVALVALLALRAGSTDDPEDEDAFKIVFTGNGPKRNDDPQFHDSWYKAGNKPNSMIVSFGKTKIPLNMMRGFEAFTWPAMMLGALDDLEIRKKQKQQTNTPAEIEDAAIVAGFVFDAALRRGPYAFTTKSLFGTYGDIGVEGVAKGLTFPAKTLIPVLGTSLASNLSNFLNDPIDRRTLDGAIWSNIPFIGPAVAPKALNAFGEPALATDFASKAFKLGVPIVYDIPTDRESIKLHELVLKQGGGPSIPTRNQLAQRLDRQPTNKEYEMFVREYGTILTNSMKKNYDRLFNAKAEFYSKAVERIGNRARDVAENKVRQAAKKP